MSHGKDTRINHQITARQVRLIDENGVNIGVVTTLEAMKKADIAQLDLVEIVPGSEPPVCKIMDFGKYRYELQKKAKEASKKQKIVEIKEIKLRPVTDKHDLEIKIKNSNRFIEEGDKVKFTLTFKGRENDHRDIGFEMMNRIRERFLETAKVEMEPKMEGRHLIMIISPKTLS